MISAYHWDAQTGRGRVVPAEELPAAPPGGDSKDVWWLDLDDPTEAEEKHILAGWFPVHALTLEDVTKPRHDAKGRPHLPKVEEFADYLFVIVNPLDCDHVGHSPHDAARHGEIDIGPADLQLSAILTPSVLVTHHYAPLPSVKNLHTYLERHPQNAGRGPDFLFHLILDDLVDEYAPVLDNLVGNFDALEEHVYRKPSPDLLNKLLHLKRTVILMRKTLVMEREVLARLTRGEFGLIDQRETAYYRNVYDHLVRYTDLVESTRDMLGDLMQSHLAAISNRLNEIMKVLTMISTVVLPMTLVAGVYGMNFHKNMPELDWDYGYPFSLGLMGVLGLGSFALFRWKKWI